MEKAGEDCNNGSASREDARHQVRETPRRHVVHEAAAQGLLWLLRSVGLTRPRSDGGWSTNQSRGNCLYCRHEGVIRRKRKLGRRRRTRGRLRWVSEDSTAGLEALEAAEPMAADAVETPTL